MDIQLKDIFQKLDEVGALLPAEVRNQRFTLYYQKNVLALKNVLPLIEQNQATKVLDVGIGRGITAMVLRRMGLWVAGVDTWAAHTQELEDTFGNKSEMLKTLTDQGIELAVCDIEKENLPFQDGSFDLVFFTDVIEHLHNPPQKPLEEIRRVLKVGGLLVLTTPNVVNLRNRMSFLLGRSIHSDFIAWFGKSGGERTEFFGHSREYTLSEIKEMFRQLDFAVIKTRFSNCLLLPTPVSNKGRVYYTKDFRINSLKRLTMVPYLLGTSLIPTLRHEILVIARKMQ